MTSGTTSWNKLQTLFKTALEMPVEQRAPFIEKSCNGNESLREQLRELVTSHDHAGTFLDEPAWTPAPGIPGMPGAAGTLTDSAAIVGRRLRGYQINRVIASGGMGTVYEAQQEHPQRRVALKVMRGGIASRAALQRFEFEVEALGRLQHPAIAPIYEAGTFELDGSHQPYFAMEFVHGCPLTDYTITHSLTIRQRLMLFVRVCEGVDHAHKKGVIHRDLKPANIFVVDDSESHDSSGAMLHPDRVKHEAQPESQSKSHMLGPDGTKHGTHSRHDSALADIGRPKILDFGIARSTDADIQSPTQRTDVGQLIGTIAYMSPEQIEGNPAHIDTRCDVYALGVILYELLAGRLPHDDLQRKTVPEAVRIVREDEPRKLSSINRVLRGDLEWITMKALEKDRARRYGSAAELAADIGRHLNHEPVLAGPPSATYRFRKMVKRHRAAAAAAAGIALSLVAGITVATWMYFVAAHQRDFAREETTRARDAEHEAEARVKQIMEMVNQMTALTEDQLSSIAGATKTRQALAEAALAQLAQLDTESLQWANYQLAYSHQRIGEVQITLGRTADALTSYSRSLEIRKKDAALHPSEGLAQRSLGVGYWKLGEAQFIMGRLAEALVSNRHSLQLHELAEQLKNVDGNSGYLGFAYRRIAETETAMGEYEAALADYQRCFECLDAALRATPDFLNYHRSRAMALCGQGKALAALGRREEALEMFSKSVQVLQLIAQRSGPANVWQRTTISKTLIEMAQTQLDLGRGAEAIGTARNAVDSIEPISAADADNVETRQVLGAAYAMLSRSQLGAAWIAEALASGRASVSSLESVAQTDPNNAGARRDLAIACQTMGRAYRVLAAQPTQSAAGRETQLSEARAWLGRARQTLEQLQLAGTLGGADAGLPAQIDDDLAQCGPAAR